MGLGFYRDGATWSARKSMRTGQLRTPLRAESGSGTSGGRGRLTRGLQPAEVQGCGARFSAKQRRGRGSTRVGLMPAGLGLLLGCARERKGRSEAELGLRDGTGPAELAGLPRGGGEVARLKRERGESWAVGPEEEGEAFSILFVFLLLQNPFQIHSKQFESFFEFCTKPHISINHCEGMNAQQCCYTL